MAHTWLQIAGIWTWEDKHLNGPLLNELYVEAFFWVFEYFECQKKLINENHPQYVATIDRKLQATPDVVLAATAIEFHNFY